jgi:hypothetical protein
MTPHSPDPENPVLRLDAKGLLDFVDAQNRKERDYFDRLLKWFAGGVAIVVAVFGYFGYQNLSAVQKIGEQIREETKKQLTVAVAEELTKEKVQDQIENALRQKTDAQFQDAINGAVAEEMNKPQRQKILEAVTQRQVDGLTKRLQNREDILKLGDTAVSQSPKSGPALVELRKRWKTSPDEPTKSAARGEIARVMAFWGGGATYLSPEYEITSLNGQSVKQPALTTCDLLILLRSTSWQDRARSASLLAGHQEKGVPDALVRATSDEYLDVARNATNSLRATIGRVAVLDSIPDADELQQWWAKEGPEIAAKSKPLNCK